MNINWQSALIIGIAHQQMFLMEQTASAVERFLHDGDDASNGASWWADSRDANEGRYGAWVGADANMGGIIPVLPPVIFDIPNKGAPVPDCCCDVGVSSNGGGGGGNGNMIFEKTLWGLPVLSSEPMEVAAVNGEGFFKCEEAASTRRLRLMEEVADLKDSKWLLQSMSIYGDEYFQFNISFTETVALDCVLQKE